MRRYDDDSPENDSGYRRIARQVLNLDDEAREAHLSQLNLDEEDRIFVAMEMGLLMDPPDPNWTPPDYRAEWEARIRAEQKVLVDKANARSKYRCVRCNQPGTVTGVSEGNFARPGSITVECSGCGRVVTFTPCHVCRQAVGEITHPDPWRTTVMVATCANGHQSRWSDA